MTSYRYLPRLFLILAVFLICLFNHTKASFIIVEELADSASFFCEWKGQP